MHEVTIVGAGIAGCTAAIYAARKRMDYALISETFGGQFLESGEILNYPGVTRTDGEVFSELFERQLEFNKVKPMLGEKIKKIEKIDGGFSLETGKNRYESKTVIIATGSRPMKLGVPGEDEFANKGVTYCSVCDGPLFPDKTIAIIGGGNSALQGVDFTKNVARQIYLLNINEEFTAHEYLVEKAKAYENVTVINKARTTRITGGPFVKGITYEREGKEVRLAVDGVIIEIGRSPNTDFVKGFLELDERRHIKIDCQGQTSVEGVFAAGDCASGQEFQYVIAAGQGCIALLKAARYLANRQMTDVERSGR